MKNTENKNTPDSPNRAGADKRCYRHVNQLGITPGQWSKLFYNPLNQQKENHYVAVEHIQSLIEDKCVEVCRMEISNKNMLNDLNLIVSAPDLYEALMEAKRLIVRMRIYMKDNKLECYHDEETFEQIKTALDKAAGIYVD